MPTPPPPKVGEIMAQSLLSHYSYILSGCRVKVSAFRVRVSGSAVKGFRVSYNFMV